MTLATQAGAKETNFYAFNCEELFNGDVFIIQNYENKPNLFIPARPEASIEIQSPEIDVFKFFDHQDSDKLAYLRKFEDVWKIIEINLGVVEEHRCKDLTNLADQLLTFVVQQKEQMVNLRDHELHSLINAKDAEIERLRKNYITAAHRISDLNQKLREVDEQSAVNKRAKTTSTEILCWSLHKLAIDAREAVSDVTKSQKFNVSRILVEAQVHFETKYGKSLQTMFSFGGICGKD